MKASRQHHEIERILAKYAGQRRAEAGATLQLPAEGRERLRAEVEARYGRGFVSAQESAENFARTLAWQRNLGRWWHVLVPKIGFAGACFAAALVVFSIAHREANRPPAAPPVSDFLGMTPLADSVPVAEGGIIVPEEAIPVEDDARGDRPPAPVAVVRSATAMAEAKESVAPAPAPRSSPEPEPEPAAMLADRPGAIREEKTRVAGPRPVVVRLQKSEPRIFDGRMEIAPPVWRSRPANQIEVNLPEAVPTAREDASRSAAGPLSSEAVPVVPAPRAAEAPQVTPIPPSSPIPMPSVAVSARPQTAEPFDASVNAIATRVDPVSADSIVRIGFVAAASPPVLRRFDLVLESGTVAIRDRDGSIYRGPAGGRGDGAITFTVRGAHRSTREAVVIEGRLQADPAPGGRTLKASVRLGEGVPFPVEARER
jgi:hypothetical protein